MLFVRTYCDCEQGCPEICRGFVLLWALTEKKNPLCITVLTFQTCVYEEMLM